jgi:poly(A) polymerase
LRFRYSTEENGKLVRRAAVYTQDEHNINFSDVDVQAIYIVDRLQSNGYETYIVGGAVRDLLLGKKPKDFDIVTAANPTKIKKIFRNARIIGRRFRLVHVYFGPKIFEVSTFRSMIEGPTGNTFGTVKEDVRRRDFSLNALFYDPLKQIVVDYVDGMKDIRKRVIRPIIAMDDIFTDDPVRMIRAVKYSAASGFKLPIFLKLKIRRQSQLLAGVSPSRLTEEIFKIIHSPHVLMIMKALDSLKLYCYLQPRAAELFKTKPGYKAKYLATMSMLNRDGFREPATGADGVASRKELPGKALAALVRDYLEDIVDWDGSRGSEQVEHYKSAFSLARKFVLPMNPPRTELDCALKLIFAEHGVPIKKTRFYDRNRRRPKMQTAFPIG